ncbi:MAG TPA: hypothetical protein VNZ64_20475 [Candidatus Acidoferrum sp.]|jgi:hypothetical protein|nr:hypothetical protein [Candidatus Acidoferrum sp.]
MKTKLTRKTKQLASALLTTLVLCSIMAIFVLYYMSLIDQQAYLNCRSQTWNMAIAITEAGIEDGLAQLNANYPTPGLATDGWTYDGSTCYWRSNTLPDGNGYTAYIYITNAINPSVIARAYVNMPLVYAMRSPSSLLAVVGNPGTAQGPVTRAVQVTCAKNNLFTAALVVKNTIDLKGNGVYTDSYDSTDPAKSTNGQYDSARYSGDHGDIATDGGITDSVSVQNANIYGKIHTGPNCPVTIGSQGGVGPHGSQVNSIPTAVADGYVLQDANFTFPDTTYPNTTGYLTPTGGVVVVSTQVISTNAFSNAPIYPTGPTVGGVTTNCVQGALQQNKFVLPAPGTYCGAIQTNGNKYTYYANVGVTYTYGLYNTNTVVNTNSYAHILWGNNNYTNYYVASSLSGSNLIVGPNVVLAMPNGLTGSEDWVFTQGANIMVYAGGTSVSAAGNTVFNPNGNAGSFVVLCAPTVTSFSLAGNGAFTGCLVAPNANVTLSGGGNNNTDFCGCLMANSITMNGHFSFHWDEALSNAAKQGRFLITAWNEIK